MTSRRRLQSQTQLRLSSPCRGPQHASILRVLGWLLLRVWSDRVGRFLTTAMLALLLAPLPVLAADHAASTQPSSATDPFAVYQAQLTDAASRTLDRVVQPAPAPSSPSPKTVLEPLPSPRPSAQSSWQRVERLRPVLEPILREAGVPTELAAVVLVESGGEPAALSPKGARGLWQLMPDTARRYGLVVNGERDERLDMFKSTRAAAQYLRDLYAQFRDWPLALAAYNAGEQRVESALVQAGASDFSRISPSLPAETRQYVPAVLGALARFGGDAASVVTQHPPSARLVYAAALSR